MITIDGTVYNVGVTELRRVAEIQQGPNEGWSIAKTHIADVIGTAYSYTAVFEVKGMDVASYDALYYALTAPVASHAVVFPFAQQTISEDVFIQSVNDAMVANINNKRWGSMEVAFTAAAPLREA